MDPIQEPIVNRHQKLPDGTMSGSEPGPWAKWHMESIGDKISGLCLGVAILFSATSLIAGGDAHAAGVSAFPILAPVGGALFLLALISMFLERERHGLARALVGVGAAFLAVVALWYGREPSVMRLFLAYWIPALLGVASMAVLAWSQRAGRAVQKDARPYREQRA